MFKNIYKHFSSGNVPILHLQLHQVSYCVLKAVEKNQLTPRFYFDIFLTATRYILSDLGMRR